jgi:hypothetical protein
MTTQALIKDMFNYDPEVGAFTHRKTSRRAVSGAEAGEITHNGYRRISAGGSRYMAHHLAWLWVYGELPPSGMQVDHINGEKCDNRISNLRLATHAQNRQNMRKAISSNSSGLLGVSRHKGKFAATIMTSGRVKSLGVFNTPEEAHRTYLSAKRDLHAFCTI